MRKRNTRIIDINYDQQKTHYKPLVYIMEDFKNACDLTKTFPKINRHNAPKSTGKRLYQDGKVTGTEYILRIPMAFDIEVSRVGALSFMFVWQFAIADNVYIGRSWDLFTWLIDNIYTFYDLGLQSSQNYYWRTQYRRNGNIIKALIWVANLPYEWQFIRKRVEVNDTFADKERKPLYFDTLSGGLQFRDALRLSGGSLKSLAEDYCTTQKNKDDYDYNIVRNSHSKLYFCEYSYCVNDVIILTEFGQYIFNTFLNQYGKIPLTKTSIVGRAILEDFAEWKITAEYSKAGEFEGRPYYKSKYDWLRSLQPKTYHEYNTIMTLLYRGGYTHGNALYFADTVKAKGKDFTSSYPNEAIRRLFPIAEFLPENDIKCIDDLETVCKGKPFYGKFTFYNIEATTPHSIESKHKVCEFFYNGDEEFKKECKPLIDNGRILTAEKMTVWLTDVDYQIYKMFYKWNKEKSTVSDVKSSVYGRLPSYVVNVIKHFYKQKAVLKKQGLSETTAYKIAKVMVNSAYGKTVQQIHILKWLFDDESETGWSQNMTTHDITNNDYLKEMHLDDESILKNRVSNGGLSPFFGIYITCWARFDLLRTVAKMPYDVLYCDTDSIYYTNCEENEHIFEEYNKSIYRNNNKLIADGVISPDEIDYFYDLGEFDSVEEKTENGKFDTFDFVHMGAKRYAKRTADGEYFVTVAGLPKGTLQKYCREKKLDLFEVFTDTEKMLSVPVDYADKLCSKYIDVETPETVVFDDDGIPDIMTEKTSVTLEPIAFNVNLGDVIRILSSKEFAAKFEREDCIYEKFDDAEENYLY